MPTTTQRSLLLSLLALPCAFGYITQTTTVGGQTYTIQRTDNQGISFFLNDKVAASSNFSKGSDPATGAQASLTAWNAVKTANIHFNALQTTSTGHDSSDCKSVIVVASTVGDISAVGGALAVTATQYSQSAGSVCGGKTSSPPGTITDTDIIFAPAFPFSTNNTADTVDFQSVLTHELGHSLGANHSGLVGSTMFWSTTSNQLNQRTPSADDAAFATAIYPAAGLSQGTLSGKISLADGSPVKFGLITAIDRTAGTTIGGITAADGTYSLSVPAGSYLLSAEPFNSFISPVNIYTETGGLSSGQVTGGFLPTFLGGSASPTATAVAAGQTASANLTVTAGASSLTAPFFGIGAAGANGDIGTSGSLTGLGAAISVTSGQSIDIGMGLGGVDTSTTFLIFGRGISIKAGSIRSDSKINLGPGSPLMRFTLDIPAQTDTTLATLWIVKGNNILAFSGGLVITPGGSVITPPPTPTPVFTTSSIVNAASYTGTGVVSPGGISSIYDTVNNSLGPTTPVSNTAYDSSGNLPTSAGGVSVTFNGVAAPIYFAYAGQINLQVPFEVAGSGSAQVVVTYNGVKSAPVTVAVTSAQPSFFTFTALGTDAIIQNFPDYSLNKASNAIARGGVAILYGTGIGKLSYALATGQPGIVPPSSYTSTFSCSFGGQTSSAYAYWNYGFVGEATWTVAVPANSPVGAVTLTCTDSASGAKTQAGTIYVK